MLIAAKVVFQFMFCACVSLHTCFFVVSSFLALFLLFYSLSD